MKKISLLLIFTFLSLSLVFSQEVVYENILDKTKPIIYGSDKFNNHIISTIARGNNTTNENVQLNINFQITKKIVKHLGNNILKIKISEVSVIGNTKYKVFFVKDELLPSKISFELKYFENDILKQTYTYDKISFFEGKISDETVLPANSELPEESENETDYRLQIRNIKLIDDYYTNSTKIKSSLEWYDNIVIDEIALRNTPDLEKIFEYKEIAIRDNKLVSLVRAESFFTNLPLNSNDPELLNNNLNTLHEKSEKLETISNNIIHTLGENFLIKKFFPKALSEFLNAERICEKYNYITCTQSLTNGIFKSRTGIYTQKIDDVKKQFNAGYLDLAEDLLSQANDYQTNYNLTKDSRAAQLFIDIKQTRYNNYIIEADRLVILKDYYAALDEFNHAKNVENQFNIIPDTKLDNKISSTAKLLVLQLIEKGEQKVNANDLPSARNFYQEAIDVQNKYNLQNDYEIKNGLETLNSKIFQQQCINYQADYDERYQNALNSIIDKNYIEADEYLNEAIVEVNKHPECMISSESAENKRAEIQKAVVYQQKVRKSIQTYNNKDYQSAINEYIVATNYHLTNNIERDFSLQHNSLFDFIKERSNEFVNFSVRYYANENELDKAVSLLKILSQRNYNKKYTKVNQQLLGNKLAIRDHKTDPNINYKTHVLNYTDGNKWFKYLKKEYIKQWKKF